MPAHVPPGWPAGVHPPDTDGFEATAVAWLLDVVPPDYRLYGVLRKHPVALATMARHHLAAAVQGARQGYRMARTELTPALPPHAVDAVLTAYRREGRRLVAASRSAEVVERALRGETFRVKMQGRLAWLQAVSGWWSLMAGAAWLRRSPVVAGPVRCRYDRSPDRVRTRPGHWPV